MPESDELSVDIRTIKERIQAIENLMDILVVSSRNDVLPLFLGFFGNSRNKARVYLAVNGTRTVNEIATATGIVVTHVSTFLRKMHNAGLVSRRKVGNDVVYRKKNWDDLIGLSQSLRSTFEIDET